MLIINIEKLFFDIKLTCKKRGEKILLSPFLNSRCIKDTLSIAAQSIVTSDEINVDKWGLNLGVIPAAQFDTLFIPRLAQAFAERLSCAQASVTGQPAAMMVISGATESGVSAGGYHPHDEELIQLAHRCLTPQALKALLQDSPAYPLQQLLKRVLQGAWCSPKMLPVCWYSRVTAGRLSIAAILYLLKSQQGHDWLMHQHAPTASQVAGWTKAIACREIPAEQVAQLLTGNRPFDSISSGYPACPALVVMRWLLPLWQQPAIRKVVYRLKGRQGVQDLDAYLSRCLQRQDDVMQKDKGTQSAPEQGALLQDDRVLSPGRGMQSDVRQTALSRDNAMWPERERILAASRRMMQTGKDSLHSPNAPYSSGQHISNAGLLLLWPLLPRLFSLLGLREEEQFVSDAARWQAVYGLDRLVWGEVSPTEDRLTLNQMLCGVSCSACVPPPAPLSLLQLQHIDAWLTTIGQQLPGWQKLSPTDIRQLFLQRAGEISTEGPVPQISVWPQPWDFLLRDWPWPLTLASFPWLEQPLTINWAIDSFTG